MHSGNIYKASMTWSMPEGLNQVFVNGTMMNGARFPNSGADPFKPTLMSMTAGESDITSAALNQTAGAWVGGIVHGWCGFSWTAQGGRISQSTPGKLTITKKSFPWFTGGGKGYVTGVLAALDSPNEWQQDVRSSALLDSTIFPMRPSRILEGRIFFLDIIHK